VIFCGSQLVLQHTVGVDVLHGWIKIVATSTTWYRRFPTRPTQVAHAIYEYHISLACYFSFLLLLVVFPR
jgi:hypothetical protein